MPAWRSHLLLLIHSYRAKRIHIATVAIAAFIFLRPRIKARADGAWLHDTPLLSVAKACTDVSVTTRQRCFERNAGNQASAIHRAGEALSGL